MGSIRKTWKHIWKKYVGKMAELMGSHTVVYKEPQLKNAVGGGRCYRGSLSRGEVRSVAF